MRSIPASALRIRHKRGAGEGKPSAGVDEGGGWMLGDPQPHSIASESDSKTGDRSTFESGYGSGYGSGTVSVSGSESGRDSPSRGQSLSPSRPSSRADSRSPSHSPSRRASLHSGSGSVGARRTSRSKGKHRRRRRAGLGTYSIIPHPLIEHWKYRDQIIRRVLLEKWAVVVIQKAYRMHRLWMRYKSLIMVRRIVKACKAYLERKYIRMKLGEFARVHSARVIQMVFRNYLLPRARAMVTMQRIVRGFLGRRLFQRFISMHGSAVSIQRIVRGMLARISDRFILAQIYMKLPPFWKQLMKSVPPKEKRNRRDKVLQYQISSLKNDAARSTDHILKDVVKNGVLAPKLPFIIPQPFDKAPYVSLTDGRKMTFYSHKDSMLNPDRTPHTVHQYSFAFWPFTAPIHKEDPSTLEYDSHMNNFEVAKQYREALHCEVCDNRLRVIQCTTCIRGFCFFCAFRVHIDPARRGHDMKLMEPRIVKMDTASKSLVYHIDMATKASHDLRYIVRYMRSGNEAKRLQDEKRMAKEYEEAEERRRMEFLQAQDEAREKHDAATHIASCFRCYKARRLVRQKRFQIELEHLLQSDTKRDSRWIPFQRLYRSYSTKKWLGAYGVKFKVNRKKKKKRVMRAADMERQVPVEEIANRANFEIQQRRLTSRNNLFFELCERYTAVMGLLNTNINEWLARDMELRPVIEKIEAEVVKYDKDYTEKSAAFAANSAAMEPEFRVQADKKVKARFCNVTAAHARKENCKNIRWWILQHLRANYRRRAVTECRMTDLLHRLAWVSMEAGLVHEVVDHIEFRRSNLPETDTKLVMPWLVKYDGYSRAHHATLDAQQESLLHDEIDRLRRFYGPLIVD